MTFDGLRPGEVVGRFANVFYAPQFVAFALVYMHLLPSEPWLVASIALGVALVLAAAANDARRSSIPPRWVIFALVPLVGWWMYALRRAPASAPAPRAPDGAPTGLREVLGIFASYRYRLVTTLPPSECVRRLSAKWLSTRSPSWHARHPEVHSPRGISEKGFTVKIRHVKPRPAALDEAKGVFSWEEGRTVIDLRIGVKKFDRGWVIAWLAFILFLLSGVVSSAGRGASSADVFDAVRVLMLVGFALSVVMVRVVGMGDHARLYDLVASTLDAQPLHGDP